MIKAMRARLIAGARRVRGFAIARRLLREEDGATAVEFAIVAAPFLALVFAIMETALVFFAGQALETAAMDSARLIMTGQAQTKGWDKGAFKAEVCKKVYGLFDCDKELLIDVKNYTSFADIPLGKPITNGVVDTKTDWAPGKQNNIVVVKLMYQWPVYVSLLGLNLSDAAGGKRLLLSTVAFRNEPY